MTHRSHAALRRRLLIAPLLRRLRNRRAAQPPASQQRVRRRRSPSTIPRMTRRSSSPALGRAARSSATSRPRMCSTRATCVRPARPASASCSTRWRPKSEARAAAAARQPVLLLDGQRISGFRELRDIPTEAIQRVEILPEEVALKYGYRADQKVVNIILRQRFRSTNAQAGAGLATDGGYATGNADITRFLVQKTGRTTLNLHAFGQQHADRSRTRDPPRSDADHRHARTGTGRALAASAATATFAARRPLTAPYSAMSRARSTPSSSIAKASR